MMSKEKYFHYSQVSENTILEFAQQSRPKIIYFSERDNKMEVTDISSGSANSIGNDESDNIDDILTW